jgi:DNA-binding NarL/FixJ family response regulator
MTARILIADDNDAARGRISELLRCHDGWEVCAEVEDGLQAVLKATELKPDIVILDLAMPMMNGLQAASKISKVLPSVPIVLYTLHDLPAIHLEAKQVGVRQIVSKPDYEALSRAIENLLKEKPQESVQTAVLAAATGSFNVTSTSKVHAQPTEATTKGDHESSTPERPN